MRMAMLVALIVSALSCLIQAEDTRETKPLRLRILTYNIHHGEGTDGKFDLDRIAKIITDAKADIVALQEVDVKTNRVKGVDIASELGKLTGMHHTFGKAIDFSGGGYGNAILSKWKLESAKTHPLPSTPGNEARAALAATIKLGEAGPQFTFISTHLDYKAKSSDRPAQVKKLNDLFAGDDAGLSILAGDMNAQPGEEEIKVLREKWESAAHAPGMKAQPTYPSDKPGVLIDYVLLRPQKQWRVVEVNVLEEKVASDHRPLLVVVEWQTEK